MEVDGGKSQTQVVDLGKGLLAVRSGAWRIFSKVFIQIHRPDESQPLARARLGSHELSVRSALSWEFKGPTSAILKLRKGIEFHDGSDLNAAAYKYQLEWMMNKKNGAWTRAGLEPVKKVEIVEEYTLKWHFKRPWAGFPGTMQFTQGACIAAEALKKDSTLNEIVKLEKRVKTFKKKLAKYERKGKTKKADKARKRLAQIENKAARLKKRWCTR